ncbi:methyltransferase domain protein [Desulfitobacterium hafniense DP7]|uniref:Methyltransferase domain protein n=1 Tax=Desulfitobacterium hafniense DP7 TaxID=537010 RepID=G9XGH2_DESHA|nr:class I SAM-dependent methyltransferase [Desulfitobacterium hafniense]EHL09263.1 methyltransferase domain protein [Desulfitobacterium hafniense DP7]
MDKTERTIETYDLHAGLYEEKFMNFPGYAKRIQSFGRILAAGAKVLDLGCGPGNVAKQLVELDKEFEVLGIDLSSEMIRHAKVNVISPCVEFRVGDIRNMDLEENAFDAVIASFCLPHLTDEEAGMFIQDISKVLREGGLLYLSCMEGCKSGFETTSFSSNDFIFFNYYSEEFISNVLCTNGLKINEVQRDEYLESDGSKTNDMFFLAKKQCVTGDGPEHI